MRRASAILVGVAVVAFLFVPSASAVTVTYGHTIGGNALEYGYAIGVDGSGNVYLLGSTIAANGNAIAFLSKWDSRGALLWQRLLDFGGSMMFMSLAVDPNGTAFFTGQIPAAGGNTTFGTVIGKVLPDGTLAFSKFAAGFYRPTAIAVDPVEGGPVITGFADPLVQSWGILALDSTGGVRWASLVNRTTAPLGLTVDGNGTTFVAAEWVQYPNDIAIAAFDSTGAFVGQRRLNLPNSQDSFSIAVGANGDIYTLGYAWDNDEPILARFAPDLVPRWTEYVGSPSLRDIGFRLVSRADGTLFILGSYADYNIGDWGGFTYQVDSSGAIVDTGRISARGQAGEILSLADIAVAPDGTILMAGTSYRSPPRNATSVGDARSVPFTASWVSESPGWHADSIPLGDVAPTVTDPGFPSDDFRVGAQYQAWYGAADVPPSAMQAVATASVVDPVNRTLTFSANVSGGTPPYTYRWSFGDGNSSTESSPSHTYSEGGRYPVQLVVEDNASNRAYATADVILGGPPVITYVAISPNPTYVGYGTSFYAIGDDPDGSIVNWHWDFGDGSTWDAPYSSAYHYYYQQGTYNVTVTARDNDGLETSVSVQLRVIDQPPNPCFYYQNPTAVGYPTPFQDCSYDPDGYITNSSWDFGDGTTDSGRYVYHVFSAPGNYVVRLTVTDNAGMVASLNQSITVNVNQPPVARFSYSPSDPIAGQYVYFSGGSSYDPDGYLTSWYWDFGDGTNTTAWWPDIYHYYDRGGRYNVTLTVTDNFNGKNSTSQTLNVDIPPTATFTPARAFGKVGTPLVFNASASNDPDGRITRYLWNFGDGGNSSDTGAIVSHVFAATGTYTVTLVVWDDHNATGYFQKTIAVLTPKAPFAILAFAPSRPFVADEVVFDGTRSADPDGSIVRYIWQLGDGTVGEGATLTHAYAYPGTYAIHLTILDEDGIAVTTSSELTVVSLPHAAFSVSPQTIHVSEDATFTAFGSWDLTGSLTYHWDFGDGTFGEGWQTSKQYTDPGTYHVTLNVTNPYGVSSIAEKDITVSPPVLGHVQAADGSMISGARVTISLNGLAIFGTTTGLDGSFDVSALGPGTYTIVISKDGYNTITATWTWDGQAATAGTWTLGSVTVFGLSGGTVLISLVIVVVAAVAALGAFVWRRSRRPKTPLPGAP